MSHFTYTNNKKPAASPERKTVRIGVFVPSQCQMLDAAAIDIFGSLGVEYLTMVDGILPPVVIDSAPHVEIRYIGIVPAGGIIRMTASLNVVATNHFDDAEVAPGKLDIVYVPGPDPFAEFPADALAWLRRQAETEGVDVLSVCSGIFVCGAAGIVKDKAICGPRDLQPLIMQKGWGAKSLKGGELRWIQDGNFWSSGGVTNGNDLVAAYCRAKSDIFPRPLVELICEQLGVGDRPQKYLHDMTAEKHIQDLAAMYGAKNTSEVAAA
ncbi:class I glutamine amidotransferase-like protein [Poronia punctata]|nr:class I glutamine amidotransferase-like protein [Poronia punctata]